MKKIFATKTGVIIDAIVGIAWCAIILIFADFDAAGFYFWGGFGFGIFTFALIGVMLAVFSNKSRNTTEVYAIPGYVSFLYMIAGIIVNTIFVCLKSGTHNKVLIAINVIILVIYLIGLLITLRYVSRLEIQSEKVINKTRPITDISSKIGSIAGMTSDPEAKKSILVLKEKVDYSSNMSQKFSQDAEDAFVAQLNQLQTLVLSQAGKDEIISKVNEITAVWNTRNAVINSYK